MFGRLLLLLAVASLAHATLIDTDPGTGSTINWSTTTLVTGNPLVVDGVTVTSDGPIVTSDNHLFALEANGYWSGFSYVSASSSTDYFQFALAAPSNFVGAFMNYDPLYTAVISAIGADGVTVLESYILNVDAPIDTPSGINAGAFRGIELTSNDIYYFRLTGGYLLTSNLESGALAEAPEPGTIAMVGAGLLFLGIRTRRRRK